MVMEEIEDMFKKIEQEVKKLEDIKKDTDLENISDKEKIIEQIDDIISVIKVH